MARGGIVTESRPAAVRPTGRAITVAIGQRVTYHYAERLNEVHIYSRAGLLLHRVALPALPVPTDHVAGSQGTVQMLWVTADAQGRVWIEVPRATRGTTRDWWVVNEAGQLEGVVRTGTGDLLSVSDSAVYQVTADQDGIEVIRRCPVQRAR